MALYGSDVESGIHTLLCLVRAKEPVSAAELARYQGTSATQVAKVLHRLENAAIVRSKSGKAGGYQLAREAGEISLADITDAIEGKKSLFLCRDIRLRCELFEGSPPEWATCSMCSVNSAMRRAEAAMRDVLKQTTLLSLAQEFVAKAPKEFLQKASQWFADQREQRVLPKRPLQDNV